MAEFQGIGQGQTLTFAPRMRHFGPWATSRHLGTGPVGVKMPDDWTDSAAFYLNLIWETCIGLERAAWPLQERDRDSVVGAAFAYRVLKCAGAVTDDPI
jgi:hypothetical protein